MFAATRATATLSAVRAPRAGEAGAARGVEDGPGRVLLKREPSGQPFAPARMEDVSGVLKYEGPPVSVEDTKLAIAEGASARCLRSLERDER